MKKSKFIRILAATTLLTVGLSTIAACGSDEPSPVLPQEKTLTIEGSSSLKPGDSVTFVAKCDGAAVEGVQRKSNNKKAVIIDSGTGEVTALAVGTAEISVSKDGYKAGKLVVTVTDPTLKGLTIVGENTVQAGSSITFTAKDTDGGATLNDVIWTTSDTNVATIAKNTGILTGRSEGQVTVTANKEGYNPATLLVTVTKGSTIEDGSHIIVFTSTVGVTYNCDKTTAKQGETVSFTISLAEGVTVTKVLLNGTTEITNNNGTYSFVMPDEDVTIKASISVESDVSIGGEQAIGLVKGEDGIYKSDELEIVTTSQLTYYVKNEQGEVVALNYSHFDTYKCFGQIETAKEYNKYGFQLPGGYKYIFYYNPQAEKPCYIVRTEVTVLPNNATTFGSLFDEGKVTTTTYPANVSKVNYTSSVTNDKYEFKRYKNNESIAKVTNLIDDSIEKAVVYKKFDGKHETVVDTYVEGKNDPTKKDDTTAFSGVYNIVENEASLTGYKSFEKTKREAEFDANHYSHDMNSIEFDIMHSYRVGFGADEGIYKLTKSSLVVESTPLSDGGFTTTIDSTKKFEDDGQSYYRYFTYDVEISFNKNGSIKTGKYLEKSYGTEDYDFKADKFLTGGEDRGTIEKELTFSYEYSETLEEAPTFDTTPYFISEVSNFRVNNKNVNTDDSKNVLKKGDVIETSTGTLSFDYSPTTALDTWQYDIIESTNEQVIGHSNSYKQFKALGFGEAELTLGNHTTNTVTAQTKVSVPSNAVPVRSLYFDGTYGSVNETIEVVNAQKVRIYGNAVSKISLKSSPNGANNTELNFEVNKPELLSVSYDDINEVLTLDASKANVTETTEVKIKVTSPNWDPDVLTQYTELIIVIEPGSTLTIDDLVGTWKALPGQSDGVSTDKDAITFTNTKVLVKNDIQYYKGTATNGTYTREFYWGLDSKNMPVALGITSLNDTVYITYNTTTKQIGFYLEYVEGDIYSEESETIYLLGFLGGEEEYDIYYEMFEKVA